MDYHITQTECCIVAGTDEYQIAGYHIMRHWLSFNDISAYTANYDTKLLY